MYQGEAGGYWLAIYQKELIKEKDHGGSRNRIYIRRGVGHLSRFWHGPVSV